MSATKYWLMKSEPDVYSLDDLRMDEGQTTYWEGVRNYQARNMMRDDMKVGDGVLYYHSNAKPPGVAGVAEIVREGYPDFTSWDPEDHHFDPKSSEENPRWFMVDLRFVEQFADLVSLSELKEEAGLDGLGVTRKGNRLSVQPVSLEHFEHIVAMGRARGPVITRES